MKEGHRSIRNLGVSSRGNIARRQWTNICRLGAIVFPSQSPLFTWNQTCTNSYTKVLPIGRGRYCDDKVVKSFFLLFRRKILRYRGRLWSGTGITRKFLSFRSFEYVCWINERLWWVHIYIRICWKQNKNKMCVHVCLKRSDFDKNLRNRFLNGYQFFCVLILVWKYFL